MLQHLGLERVDRLPCQAREFVVSQQVAQLEQVRHGNGVRRGQGCVHAVFETEDGVRRVGNGGEQTACDWIVEEGNLSF